MVVELVVLLPCEQGTSRPGRCGGLYSYVMMGAMSTDSRYPPTIVSVPQGLTAIDADGKVLPIVALRVDYNPAAPADYGEPATKITPLYLAEGGSIGAVFNEATIGLSEAWTPASFVGYIETALSMDDPGPFR
ncbi:hypothetical protein BHQ23_07775 [Mycobacterium gordonae]|uniref:Uncharacterized protein n=1 Tax=Mycobacterium gordonae TaxID=1778 RepID=A0A1X1W853_MYCGO|nr:hypothetical protein BHQ23_07775 [Mycobacterium gordonae]ORV82734.1 hypothetical protein AWC08_28515 [Mycobacterium gordonae]